MRLRPLRYFVALAGLIGATLFARDEQRIAQVKDAIKSVEAVMTDTNAPASDRPRLERKLEALKQELAILEEREAIETRERSLKAEVRTQTREQLREKLQAIGSDPATVEARQRELEARRLKATAERTALMNQREDAEGGATGSRRAEIDEQLFTKNEEIRSIALQQEAADNEAALVRQAQALRENLRADEAALAAPSLKAWFAKRADLKTDTTRDRQLADMAANVAENLRVTEAGLLLAKQKMAKFDEELQLLERQTTFLHRNERLEQLLATQRAQKQLQGQRMPYLVDQVEALRQSRDSLATRRELVLLEKRLLDEQAGELRDAYLERLLWPSVTSLAILLAYLALSRFVFARRYKKEELFLARRLGRYATTLLIVVVVTLYLFEDLRLIATTLGLVSAAIVISLQDVCASFCGWFVIMAGQKFTIGDRLEIEGVRGDVLDIQLLRTTLLELNNWLGVDQPTGRVIIVPNNFIFKTKVFSFTHGHPFIWGKIEVTVTYGTPAAGAMALFQKILEEETREDFAEARRVSAEMERRYGVEDADYRPKIYTRIADSGITFSLLYVSHYRNTSITRNRINRRLISELESHPHIQLAYNTVAVLANVAPAEGPSAVLGQDVTSVPFPLQPKR
ncbi:MAG TPA: mechanosensitive ion channel domain-containing protein [Lacunisphaera sp.]|jgi:small-conductance mechanosensitive channel|nr:mechanosensitive ion channel domain-containing protein [Lacunisphaera sp.]